MDELNHESVVPLYHQIKGRIIAKIDSGEWGYNHKIPAESELAEYLEVSLGTVKRALADLAAEKVIVRKKGKGSFVSKVKFGSSWIRSLLPEAGSLKVETLDFDEAGFPHKTPADRAFGKPGRFRLLFRNKGKETLSLRELYFDRGDFSLPNAKNKAFAAYLKHSGAAFAKAGEELKIKFAGAGEAEALGVKKGSPLVCVQRTSFGKSGMALEFRLDFFPCDRLSLRQDLD